MCVRKDLKYPCGKCYECLQAKRNDWSIRLKSEILQYDSRSNYFLTLTYDNEHLPLVNAQMTLSKRDVELFIKRLRFYVAPNRFKFFLCGEYGPTTNRPHYHLILFNFPERRFRRAVRLFNKAWQNGQVRKPWRLVPAQCVYATKYLITDHFWPNGVQKPFNKMSKGLGLNLVEKLQSSFLYDKNYIQEYADAICEAFGVVVYENTKSGDLVPHFGLVNVDKNILDDFSLLVNDFVRSSSDNTSKVYKFAIPKYVRQKLFSRNVRLVLNEIQNLNRSKKDELYNEQYFSYDLSNPGNEMWRQQARIKNEKLMNSLNKKYKNNNDKYLQ